MGIFQLTNLLHYAISTFNNMLSSLPSFIQNIIHAILAVCFPFYSIYQGFMVLINRIHRIGYPIYRAMTLLTRLFTFFVTLPLRIITFVTNPNACFIKKITYIFTYCCYYYWINSSVFG